jgi:NTF2 fold immunity protein
MRYFVVTLISLMMVLIDLGDKAMSADDAKSGSVYVFSIARGGIVNNARLATKIVEDIISDIYGEPELGAQQPLKVVDLGDDWEVLGTGRDGTTEGIGSLKVVISKRDGRVVELVRPILMRRP